MTRRFIDDIRSDINTQIISNGSKAITGPILNKLLIDMCDSTIQDEGGIRDTIGKPTFSVDTNWTALDTFDEVIGGDAEFLILDAPAGTLTASVTEGFTYEISGTIVLIGGANNRYDAVILVDGVPSGLISGETGEGNNDPISIRARTYLTSTPANAVFQVALRTDAPRDIEILEALLGGSVHPTNNP